MEYCATCQYCGRTIKYSSDNPNVLGCHLLKEHAGVELINFQIRKSASCCKCSADSGNNLSKSKSKPRSGLIKTTVESWTPGSEPVCCPKCKNTAIPYIKKQRDKIARSGIGAFFLLGCWPLCFLPMVMCSNSTILVCCRCCGYCFGTYDRKTGKLIPTSEKIGDKPKDCVC